MESLLICVAVKTYLKIRLVLVRLSSFSLQSGIYGFISIASLCLLCDLCFIFLWNCISLISFSYVIINQYFLLKMNFCP